MPASTTHTHTPELPTRLHRTISSVQRTSHSGRRTASLAAGHHPEHDLDRTHRKGRPERPDNRIPQSHLFSLQDQATRNSCFSGTSPAPLPHARRRAGEHVAAKDHEKRTIIIVSCAPRRAQMRIERIAEFCSPPAFVFACRSTLPRLHWQHFWMSCVVRCTATRSRPIHSANMFRAG